jgi:diguanylate cyclase (GGDEF)-like protein
VYNVIALCAVALCVDRAVRSRTDRVTWALIATGFGCYAAGTLVFSLWLQPMPEMPYPSVADLLWLLFYPFVLAGIVMAVRARSAGSVASMWLDGLIAGLGLAGIGALVAFNPLTTLGEGPRAAIIVNFAYPVSDLALVACAVGAMAVLGAWRNPTLVLLCSGFATFAAADSWYLAQVAAGTYHVGSPVDAVWALAMCLIGLAATVTTAPYATPAESRSFLIPAVFAAASIGVLGFGAAVDLPPLGTGLAVAALVAAFIRTTMAVREVVALADSRRQARTDLLTGLPNRRGFYELLEETTRASRGGALLLIDLDRFKEVNDALGHRTGDQLLHAVGQRLSAHLTTGATLSRLGGDEFAVLLPDDDTTPAKSLATVILAQLRAPVTLAGMTLHVDASIGVTAIGAGTDATLALARADVAMYRAKASRSGVELYDDDRDGDAWNRLAVVEELRDALAGGGLHLELQPIVALPDGGTVAVEALVRWTHPVRGRLAPDEFLPMAERAGLMWTLTRYVLDAALDEAAALRNDGWDLPIAVNLSASDLLNTGLVGFIVDGLDRRALPASVLHLEITESLLVEDREISDGILLGLRAHGVQVAVDDYGTGYSCLAYLRDLPVNELKIDRSFTNQLLADDRTATIVASTINLAHDLGLQIVAEGVETGEQLAWLVEHRCDKVQGYHLGRPMSPTRLRLWLADREAVVTIDAGFPPTARTRNTAATGA